MVLDGTREFVFTGDFDLPMAKEQGFTEKAETENGCVRWEFLEPNDEAKFSDDFFLAALFLRPV